MTGLIIIGIDPGLGGAMAVLIAGATKPFLYDTPVTIVTKGKKKKREYNKAAMALLLRNHEPEHTLVVLEAVHAMPRQGTTSMFSMGRGSGLWEGIIAAFELPLQLVVPRVWKNKMVGVGADKNASRLRAIELFPSVASELSRVKDDGRAEALLMAEFWRRTI